VQKPFVHVEEIVKNHWRTYGRNYYIRYDYEGMSSQSANAMMNVLEQSFGQIIGRMFGQFTVSARAN
jgi:phosphoglucomutase